MRASTPVDAEVNSAKDKHLSLIVNCYLYIPSALTQGQILPAGYFQLRL